LITKNDRRALRLRQRGQQSFNAAAQGRASLFRLRAVVFINLDPLAEAARTAPAQRIG